MSTSDDKSFFMKKVGIGVGLLELGHNNFFNHTIFYPLSTKQKKDPYITPRQLYRLNTKNDKLVTTDIYNFDNFTLL